MFICQEALGRPVHGSWTGPDRNRTAGSGPKKIWTGTGTLKAGPVPVPVQNGSGPVHGYGSSRLRLRFRFGPVHGSGPIRFTVPGRFRFRFIPGSFTVHSRFVHGSPCGSVSRFTHGSTTVWFGFGTNLKKIESKNLF